MSLIIDPRFVDVDLAAEGKRLGFLPGYAAPSGQKFNTCVSQFCGDYADEFEILPDAERTAAIEKLDAEGGMEFLVRWILNQGGEGSCVGNATTGIMQLLMAKQLGEHNAIPMSAISCYKQIGSSPGSGANCEDALEAASNVGILPLDTPENRARFGAHVMPATGFYTPYPADWKNTAKQFRFKKRFIIRSVAAMEQAGINGHPIEVGRAGHSIMYVRPTLKGGRGELYANSWGKWGFAAGNQQYGFGLDTGGMVRSSAQWAFAVVSATIPDYAVSA